MRSIAASRHFDASFEARTARKTTCLKRKVRFEGQAQSRIGSESHLRICCVPALGETVLPPAAHVACHNKLRSWLLCTSMLRQSYCDGRICFDVPCSRRQAMAGCLCGKSTVEPLAHAAVGKCCLMAAGHWLRLISLAATVSNQSSAISVRFCDFVCTIDINNACTTSRDAVRTALRDYKKWKRATGSTIHKSPI